MEFLKSVQFTLVSIFNSLNTLPRFHTTFASQTTYSFIWGTFLLFIWMLDNYNICPEFGMHVTWTSLPIMNTSNIYKCSLIKVYSCHFTRTNLQKKLPISPHFFKTHVIFNKLTYVPSKLRYGRKVALCPSNMRWITQILAKVLLLCSFNSFPDFCKT